MTSKLWFPGCVFACTDSNAKANPKLQTALSLIFCVLHWASPPTEAISCPWTCSAGSAEPALVWGAWRAPGHRRPAELQPSACPTPGPRPGLLRPPSAPAVARQINNPSYWLPGQQPSADMNNSSSQAPEFSTGTLGLGMFPAFITYPAGYWISRNLPALSAWNSVQAFKGRESSYLFSTAGKSNSSKFTAWKNTFINGYSLSRLSFPSYIYNFFSKLMRFLFWFGIYERNMARCISIQKKPQRTLLVGQLTDLAKTKPKIILRLFRTQGRVCGTVSAGCYRGAPSQGQCYWGRVIN